MKRRERSGKRNGAAVAGVILTLAVHLCLIVICLNAGLTYLDPPPPEQALLLDFTVEQPQEPELKFGKEPQAPEKKPEKPVELVQKSQAQNEGKAPNVAKEATVGTQGDVEVPEPPREKEINRRALFPSADNSAEKDTLVAQKARETSERITRGLAEGNASEGTDEGAPNARLEGREPIDGYLPMPEYKSRDYGTVVVRIWVQQDGTVYKAETDVAKSTVTDRNLWRAAETAAKGSKFTQSRNSPVLQEGTITYRFILK